MSQNKFSRIATGRLPLLPSVVDVEQMLTALDVDKAENVRAAGAGLVANTEYQDVRPSVRWRTHHRQRELASLEWNATEVRR